MQLRLFLEVNFVLNAFFTKLSQLIDISKGNNFQESFKQFGGLGLSSRSFLI